MALNGRLDHFQPLLAADSGPVFMGRNMRRHKPNLFKMMLFSGGFRRKQMAEVDRIERPP
ncbi:hypothetical protein HMSSN036_45530 [Paenibacillus macerans]|nr:hypothetical protein HMSSN036_45530 [Paenibacillus macerans]